MNKPKFSRAKKDKPIEAAPIDPWAELRKRDISDEERTFQRMWTFLEELTGRTMTLADVEEVYDDLLEVALGSGLCSEAEMDERCAEAEKQGYEQGVEDGSIEDFKDGVEIGAGAAVDELAESIRGYLPDEEEQAELDREGLLDLLKNLRTELDKMGEDAITEAKRNRR